LRRQGTDQSVRCRRNSFERDFQPNEAREPDWAAAQILPARPVSAGAALANCPAAIAADPAEERLPDIAIDGAQHCAFLLACPPRGERTTVVAVVRPEKPPAGGSAAGGPGLVIGRHFHEGEQG